MAVPKHLFRPLQFGILLAAARYSHMHHNTCALAATQIVGRLPATCR